MTLAEPHFIPATNFRVRRRKTSDGTFLILLQDFFLIDDVSDAVWRAADGVRNVQQIAEVLDPALNLSPEEALAATRIALGAFAEGGLVEWRH